MRVEMSTNVPGISQVTNGSLTFYTVRVSAYGMRSTLGNYNTMEDAIKELTEFKKKHPPARMNMRLAQVINSNTNSAEKATAAIDAHKELLFELLETVPPHELDSTKATTVAGVKVPASVVEEYIYKKLI